MSFRGTTTDLDKADILMTPPKRLAGSIRTGLAVLGVVLVSAVGAAPAGAAFGASDFSTRFVQPRTDPIGGDYGPAVTRAGGHGDLVVDFSFNTADDGITPTEAPDESLKTATVDLPAGFYGNPRNAPTCSSQAFSDIYALRCPAGSQVGRVEIYTAPVEPGSPEPPVSGVTPGLYNLATADDETARIGFAAATVPVQVSITPRSTGDYGLTATVKNTTQALSVYRVRMTIWGDPSDPAHDAEREVPAASPLPGTPARPFLSMPSRCDGALTSTLRANSWENPKQLVSRDSTIPALTDCDQLSFEPSLTVAPTGALAGQPSGYGIDLNVPQTETVDEPATPTVKDVSAALPEGVAISPGAADGLRACSDEQLATESADKESCPDASKIGIARISTPLLEEKLEGSVYLGTQKSQDPASGEMYRMFIAAYGKGVRVKLKGQIKADPRTGQLTASFAQNPQLPFDNLHLQLDDGPRAVLVNPTTCGTKTTRSVVSSYAGQSATSDSSFEINQGCPTGQFSPAFTAGTLDPFAGGLSPFVMTTTRTDADQDLSGIRLDLPSGLLGMLGKIPVCGDAQAAVGTCEAVSRLGSTTVGVGTGPNPYALGGTVSLAGPYKGAPYSLSIAVPAKAGPLDLGMVVVRSPLIIDANKARVSAPVDDLPQIVGGVPMHYRSISVALDRPGFMFNATNCSPQTVVGTLTSSNGAVQRPGVRYQAQGCDKLKLTPSLKLTYSGKADLKKGKNPKFTADLGQTFGQAGLKRVRVTLPLTSTLKADNANALCTPAQAAARDCPAASIVGRASATTPALHEPLTGPVYFLQGTKTTASGKVVKTLPKLWLKLRGSGVDLDLRADSATNNKTSQLMATFVDIPDAPIANFKLEIDGGSKGILGAPSDRDPCIASRRAEVQFDGQNGARQIRSLNIAAPDCGVRAEMNATSKRARVWFTGIGAGKVTVSGKGLVKRSRTIKSNSRATVTVRLSASTRRQIASGRTVKLRLTATFDPQARGKKTTKITKTVTIKGAKKRR
ncbi:hypothetical protein [Patulibacter americanus]|uniref:hypothetical protein n=1 Tax=Patulibacter americanus TaxID=588672 RepID=UPI00041A89DD|nr:hypothetical protein [Patulibacter americanus]